MTAEKAGPPVEEPGPEPGQPVVEPLKPEKGEAEVVLHIKGTVPSELWTRLGTKVLPKLRSCKDLGIGIEFRATFSPDMAEAMKAEIRQILADLGLTDKVTLD